MELERHVDERDFKLLENDRYTFAVLSRILPGPCSVTLTDHERFILCHSIAPYPVWLWTPDDPSESEKQRTWEAANSVCPITGGFSYNLKYSLAEFFIAKAREQGLNARVTTNMYAYDCPAPIAPAYPAEGFLYRCTVEDTETVADMIFDFHASVGDARFDLDTCRQLATNHIAGHFYFWKNPAGEPVACCSFHPNGDLASVGSVYTVPAHRRKHYAQQMVFEVTRLITERGLTPMLYTDADYAASNACYEKIGYVLRGKLCTIQAMP